MKSNPKKLRIAKETLYALDRRDLRFAGATGPTINCPTRSCPSLGCPIVPEKTNSCAEPDILPVIITTIISSFLFCNG